MPILSLTLVDDQKRPKTLRVEMETQASIVDYQAVADAFIATLQDVTDLGVHRADLVLRSISSGFAAQEGSNIDVGATFVGYLAGDLAGRKATHKLPGVKDAFRDGTGGIVIADEDMVAYLANFLTAGNFRLSDGQTISEWIKGKLDK